GRPRPSGRFPRRRRQSLLRGAPRRAAANRERPSRVPRSRRRYGRRVSSHRNRRRVPGQRRPRRAAGVPRGLRRRFRPRPRRPQRGSRQPQPLMTPGCFTLEATEGAARAGVLHTAHGDVPTPAFMPVGTKATVKTVDPDELRALGTRILLGNTYHLHFRPGEDVIAELGGLHAFMSWEGPILTDSGGFQVFSLRDTLLAADDDGVTFQSVYDGSPARFTPELAARIQADLGSDVAMCLDICPPAGVARPELEVAVRRTTLWAERQRDLPRAAGQLRFAITQGGLDRELRALSSEDLVKLDFDGYAIGGLSVGEERAPMFEATTDAAAALPEHKPRYFMGIGDPEGVVEVIARG